LKCEIVDLKFRIVDTELLNVGPRRSLRRATPCDTMT
jgi:hypothetical protein